VTNHLFREAMLHWGAGNPLPLDLAVKLMEAGYDVVRLERKHRRT